ncbi:MFS transporter [Ferrovibrio sp.]|uniref:MFS transporter n=1 Tax=Ferrovibrio sp. TaxID=1917215 RepID=UPI0025B961B0|nr:MFS transporter [Ferrovibrio sp.]MBX3454543.1 MFS transporter [Ferrovibrio sp.]
MLPMFLAMVDSTIVTTALSQIAADLGGVERIPWIIVSYLISAAIVTPVYGRLGDVLGRRRLMAVALVIAMLGTVLCSMAQSMEMLIFSRMLHGLGSGGLMTLSQALIGQAVPPHDRARYQGYLAGVAVCASAFGPVAGGFLTEHFGWRSIFLVNIPLILLAIGLVFRLPPRSTPREPFRFDFFGLLLFAAFISALLMLLEQLRRWNNIEPWLLICLLGIIASTFPLLLWQERRVKHPLLPIPLLSNPTIWRSDVLAMCHGGLFVSMLTFVPIYFSTVRGMSAAEMGLLLLPTTMGVGVGSILTGQIVSRTHRTAIMPSIGLIFTTLLLLGLALTIDQMESHTVGLAFGLVSLTLGTVMGVVQVSVQSEATPGMIGIAAASVQLSRSVGAAIGTALAGSLLFALVSASGLVDAATLQAILQGGTSLSAMDAAKVAALRAEISGSYRYVFLLLALYGALGCFMAWSLPRRHV